MLRFQMAIHRRCSTVTTGPVIEWQGEPVRTLVADMAARSATFEVPFEGLCEQLNAWPRMFLEPDGALVWVGETPERWQVDGVLNERGGNAWYVELKGTCPRDALEQVLGALGWPAVPVMFQLSEAGAFVDEAEFFRLAARSGKSRKPEAKG